MKFDLKGPGPSLYAISPESIQPQAISPGSIQPQPFFPPYQPYPFPPYYKRPPYPYPYPQQPSYPPYPYPQYPYEPTPQYPYEPFPQWPQPSYGGCVNKWARVRLRDGRTLNVYVTSISEKSIGGFLGNGRQIALDLDEIVEMTC